MIDQSFSFLLSFFLKPVNTAVDHERIIKQSSTMQPMISAGKLFEPQVVGHNADERDDDGAVIQPSYERKNVNKRLHITETNSSRQSENINKDGSKEELFSEPTPVATSSKKDISRKVESNKNIRQEQLDASAMRTMSIEELAAAAQEDSIIQTDEGTGNEVFLLLFLVANKNIL